MFKPEGQSTVSPYLMVHDVGAMMAFLTEVFGAEEIERLAAADGVIRHGEVRINESVIMMGHAKDDYPAMPCMIHVYVDDVDVVHSRAVAAGAVTVTEPTDRFYGLREAGVKGPQGNQWWLGQLIEEVDPDEMQRRAAENF